MFLVVFSATVCALALALCLAWSMMFRGEFVPVSLSDDEQRLLSQKIARVEGFSNNNFAFVPDGSLSPEPYREKAQDRLVVFTERELNSLLAGDPDLARRMVVDLSDDLATARMMIPLDPEIPLLGGKTLRVSAGLELVYAEGRPVVRLKGVSVWGVPLPNAWLGNLKNVDLVKEFGGSGGFWEAFAAGIDSIRIEDGKLHLRLKE